MFSHASEIFDFRSGREVIIPQIKSSVNSESFTEEPFRTTKNHAFRHNIL